MFAPEHFQRFSGRMHAALLYILKALADPFSCFDLRGDVEQTLLGFGILHDCFSLSGKHQRFFCLLKVLHGLRGISAESDHRLNVFLDVEHEYLGLTS
jgi:hypothetical protein